ERTPEIPQTVKFVVDTLKSAERDPRLGDYAVAQVFGESRAAATYETRAESMAADLADRQPPEQVKKFRASILELRKDPELGNKLFDRKDAVYGRLLPGYNVKGKDVPDAIYFTIGPDKQLDAWEAYLKIAEGAARCRRGHSGGRSRRRDSAERVDAPLRRAWRRRQHRARDRAHRQRLRGRQLGSGERALGAVVSGQAADPGARRVEGRQRAHARRQRARRGARARRIAGHLQRQPRHSRAAAGSRRRLGHRRTDHLQVERIAVRRRVERRLLLRRISAGAARAAGN